MLDTSKDVLFIVLAFCVLWLTVFISWLLFYLIKVFRSASKTIDKTQETIKMIDDFVNSLKEKITKSTSHLLLLGELAKQGMSFMDKRMHSNSDDDNQESRPKRKKRATKK